MANRVKDDERNERTIRNLLKLPDNRRCINCNSLGPQYVCTSFWTFVCTTCSGIHREFTHRVKSVSMAKFTSQEVSALQGGGNASAKVIYFKEWDPQRHSLPDSSNVEKLRDFIKHVYVDRRYTGERSFDKAPRVKMGEPEESENKNIDTYQGGSRSPPYEDSYERRYSDRPSPGGRSDDRNNRYNYDERRSPGYDQESRQYTDYRRSPARTEIVNDWRRDDRFGNGRRSDDSKTSDGGSKLEGKSPDHQRDLNMSSPPLVRPVREILGENVSPLRIIEPPKGFGGRSADGSVRTQRTVSSSSLASSNGNPTELRTETSLIDFDAVPEAPPTSTPQTQQIATSQTIPSSNDNWANFDSVSEPKVSQAPSSANLLESVLSELSVPTSLPGHLGVPGSAVNAPMGNVLPSNNSIAASMGHVPASPFGGGAAAAQVGNSMAFPQGGASAAVPVQPFNSFGSVANGGQWHNTQPQQNVSFPGTGINYSAQPFTATISGASSNQSWNSGVITQPSLVEVRPTLKKELPEDLFTSSYSFLPPPVPGWQTGPSPGIGYNMQYNMATPVPTFPQPSTSSTNPFNLHNEPSHVQAPTFPSMASLQGALPNVAALTGIQRTSSLGTPSPTWMPVQSSHPFVTPPQGLSYASPVPPQGLSYAPAMPPSAYMGQQVPSNIPPRQQGVMGFGFGAYNQSQQQGGLYSGPATPNALSSVGGNPFG
ncbi:hypothetical protein RJ639_001449 [Escallonia herrerae]|uniref:Arf-GAP domain-containing protein n=1 Tax=Escallonia herrerae TaxID=1293975 RepID=A0AA89BFA7_9ASTE|nr:hypothetical protein RJ639_001449 [Escallonia herrerae]